MPLFFAALLGGLIQVTGSIVGRVLISLGIGYISYTALDTSLDWIKTQIASAFSGLPAQALAVLGACNVGSCLALVLSAIAVRLLLDGLQGGTIKKIVQK